MAYSDDILSQVLGLGGIDAQQEQLQRQMGLAQALRGRRTQSRATPLGAALSGLADVGGALGAGLLENSLAEKSADLERQRLSGREAFARGVGMAEKQGAAEDTRTMLGQRPFLPFADDYNAQTKSMGTASAGLRQQEARNLALLSGDPVLKGWASAQKPGANGDALALQRMRLAQGDKRLQFALEAEKRKAEQQAKALGVREEKNKATAEAAERKAAEKKVSDALQREAGMRKEVTSSPLFKDYIQSEVSHTNLTKAASDPSSAGDLAIIFEFMKTLDPTSVVKEGEQVQVQNATNIPGQYLNMLQRIQSGQRLSAEQRADLVRVAGGIMETKKAALRRLTDGYKGIAERSGADFRNVLPLSLGGPPVPAMAPQQTPATPAPAPKQTGTEAKPATVAPEDTAALEWLKANPNSPDAPAVRERLQSRGVL